MRSIAIGAPDSSTIVVCLFRVYRTGAELVSLLTTTVCVPGVYSVNTPFVLVTVVVVWAKVCPDQMQIATASKATPILLMFLFIYEDSYRRVESVSSNDRFGTPSGRVGKSAVKKAKCR